MTYFEIIWCNRCFRGFFSSSLFPPQGCWAFIIDINNRLQCISMDTLFDSSNEFDTCVVYLCTFSEYLSQFPTHSLFLFFFLQQPAPLSWRIWVIWITRGPLDTGALSVNTPPLHALMMTWKVSFFSILEVESACKWILVQRHQQTCDKHSVDVHALNVAAKNTYP